VKVLDVYPAGAVGGCCLILKTWEIKPGEKVVDLDIDLDDLPMQGRLVLSQKAVQLLNTELGWKVVDVKEAKSVAAEQAKIIRQLETENARLLEALRGVFAAAQVADVDTGAFADVVSA
jgi:hypothetical protein